MPDKVLDAQSENCIVPEVANHGATLAEKPSPQIQTEVRKRNERSQQMDSVQIYKLFDWTSTLAKRYERAVREGKELLAAVEWCRYLVNAGILELLTRTASEAVIPIDVNELRDRVKRMQDEAQYQWTCSQNKPHIDLSEVEAIHRKVDAMAEWMLRHDADVIIGVPAIAVHERKVIEVDFAKVS
jgi:hypothetical protein